MHPIRPGRGEKVAGRLQTAQGLPKVSAGKAQVSEGRAHENAGDAQTTQGHAQVAPGGEQPTWGVVKSRVLANGPIYKSNLSGIT